MTERRRRILVRALALPVVVSFLTSCSGGDGFSGDDAALCAAPTVLQVHGPVEAARDIREINVDNLQATALKGQGKEANRLAAAYLGEPSPGREQALVASLREIKSKCASR